MPVLLEGKKVAEAVYSKILLDISLLPFVPKLVVVNVGDNAASQTYVRSKTKKASDLGLRSETVAFPENVTEETLCAKLKSLNQDKDVHGILVQLPLPSHIVKNRVLKVMDPLKDVDGLHPENIGRLWQGEPRFIPCTPAGILEILKFYSIRIEGMKAVIVGRSDIVGKPMTQVFLMNDATVTVCHSHTKDLAKETSSADILVASLGKPNAIKAEMVKPGAVVIDVGINRQDGRLVGDVAFDGVYSKVSAITPVPGGVGPMTIAMLMKNLLTAAILQTRSR